MFCFVIKLSNNFSKAYIWRIEAHDDESIRIEFKKFQSFNNRRACFHVKDLFKTFEICTNQQYPSLFHHIGSFTLLIEPEFIWTLISYDIRIDKFKKSKYRTKNKTCRSA